jgi:hypothetical protein
MRSIPNLPLLVVVLLNMAALLTTGVIHVVRRSRYNREMAAGVAYCIVAVLFIGQSVATGLHRDIATPFMVVIASTFFVQMMIFGAVMLKCIGSNNTGFAVLNALLVLLFAEMTARGLMYSLHNHPSGENALHVVTLVADAIIALLAALVVGSIAVEVYHSAKNRRNQNRQRNANRQPAA